MPVSKGNKRNSAGAMKLAMRRPNLLINNLLMQMSGGMFDENKQAWVIRVRDWARDKKEAYDKRKAANQAFPKRGSRYFSRWALGLLEELPEVKRRLEHHQAVRGRRYARRCVRLGLDPRNAPSHIRKFVFTAYKEMTNESIRQQGNTAGA